MHIQKNDDKKEKGPKRGLKSEEPLAEGPAKGMTRRRFLRLGGAGLLASALASCVWDPSGLAAYTSDGSSPPDAKAKDAEALPDVKQHDAKADTAVPDSAIPDAAVHDAGIDSGMVDAEAPDSTVPDSAVDAGPVCGTYDQNRSFWFLELNETGLIGGYNLQYTAQNGNDSTLDITCEATGNPVSAEVFALGVPRTVYLSQGNKNLTVTVTDVWPDLIKMEASVSNP